MMMMMMNDASHVVSTPIIGVSTGAGDGLTTPRFRRMTLMTER